MGSNDLVMQLGSGCSERLGFFGDQFGVTHLPAGTPVGGVLVCSPLYSEFLKNNRREVMLGRRLAEAGWAVQRFHYRGTGNSGGEPSQLTLESMREDALEARTRLEEAAGVGADVVVSTRMAGLAASAVLGPETRMVLWEPVASGKKYFRELTRSLLILGVKRGTTRTAQDLEEEFAETGAIDIAGFSVARTLRDSAAAAELEIPEGDGKALILQLGRTAEIRPDIQKVVDAVEAAGRKAQVVPLDFEEAWWFHQDVNVLDPSEGTQLDEALVAKTAIWLQEGSL